MGGTCFGLESPLGNFPDCDGVGSTMRLAPLIAVALTLLLACQSTEDASHTPSPTMTFAASATPSPSLTPTPECDEKCQMLRTFTPLPTTTVSPPPVTYPAGTRRSEERRV